MYAVGYNHLFALQTLQKAGADFSGSSDQFPTIAHVAAKFANRETLAMLTRFRLRLPDIDCIGRDGLTVVQILEERVKSGEGDSQELVDAFTKFLGSVDVEPLPEDTGDGVGEIFYDAMDTMIDV